MYEVKVSCDICKKPIKTEHIDKLPNDEEENYALVGGTIVYSNYPSYIDLTIIGHGLLGKEDKEKHICKDCYEKIEYFVHKMSLVRLMDKYNDKPLWDKIDNEILKQNKEEK